MKTKFTPVAFSSMLAVAALAEGTPRPVNSWLDAAGPLGRRQVSSSKPNIVFILMDNLGYGEAGCYGGGHHPRGADASNRQAGDRGHATDQFQRGGTVHPEPLGDHDRALFDSFRNAISLPTRRKNTRLLHSGTLGTRARP